MPQRDSLPTVQRTTLATDVYKALRNAILGGAYAKGERLIQEDLAAQMQTSRIPVRDALKRLVNDGLVVMDGRGRHYANSFGVEDAHEVYALRAILEPYAARLGCENLSDENEGDLEELLQGMDKAASNDSPEDYVDLNRSFHMLLYEAAGNGRLMRFIETLWSGTPPVTPISVPGQMRKSMDEHRKIMEAIRNRDAVSVHRLIRAHVERAGAAIQAQLEAPAKAKAG